MIIAESVVGISVNEKVKRNSTVLKNPSNTLLKYLNNLYFLGFTQQNSTSLRLFQSLK